MVIPGVLALVLAGVGVWFYRDQHPSVRAVPDAGVTSGPDGGAVTDASVRTTDVATEPETAVAVAPTRDAAVPTGTPHLAEGAPLNASPVESVHPLPTVPDPRHGHFTLSDATGGMPGTGALVATIETSMGAFTCELLSDEAPNTVANFVGLARGTRDFWDSVAGRWVRRPFYDGSIFHRVIPDFMIQGGDVLRSGRGGTGYEIADENVRGHDAAGQLCMANHGPGTNAGQFFITEGAKPHLDGSYSIFGRCHPTELVGQIARVPAHADRPDTPVFILHVTVHRARSSVDAGAS